MSAPALHMRYSDFSDALNQLEWKMEHKMHLVTWNGTDEIWHMYTLMCYMLVIKKMCLFSACTVSDMWAIYSTHWHEGPAFYLCQMWKGSHLGHPVCDLVSIVTSELLMTQTGSEFWMNLCRKGHCSTNVKGRCEHCLLSLWGIWREWKWLVMKSVSALSTLALFVAVETLI